MIKIVLGSLLIIFSSGFVEAKLLQILHTNDNHSYLDHTAHDLNIGGVSRLKELIEYYKTEMKKNKIETLTLDAGDFTEGNIYFLADGAKKSFLSHSALGYDAVTLGNHEYLMGVKALNNILGEVNLNFAFLASNIVSNATCPNINSKLIPFKELVIDGIRIGIFGLTTDEVFYRWRFECGKILNPIKNGLYYEKLLRERKNNLVIGLTHIGIDRDIKLASKSSEMDLIIGGHSHTTILKPVYIKNKIGRFIPILQAGALTKYLGRIMLDISENTPPKIISYELIPVENINENTDMIKLVLEAKNDLIQFFGEGWLETNIGYSDLSNVDPKGEEKWAVYITEAIKEKVKADIAIHSPMMNGEAYPVGRIDRLELLNSFPRVFDLYDKEGWSIYTASIKGVWLKLLVENLLRYDEPLIIAGITLKILSLPFGIKIKEIYINGKKLNPFKSYNLALTEGVVKGLLKLNHLSTGILKFPNRSQFRIWSTLEEKIKKEGRIFKLKAFEEKTNYFYKKKCISCVA